MLDISFTKKEDAPFCDIELYGNDILRNNTIISAIEIMLRTDRRATKEEYIEGRNKSFPYKLRGWWGDSFRSNPIGSKLWLMLRRKATNKVKMQCEQYIEEALAPLVESGAASKVNVFTEWISRGVLKVNVTVVAANDATVNYVYNMIWQEVVDYVR